MSTQELRHSTRNFVNLAEDYLKEESLICLSIWTWPRHIDHYERVIFFFHYSATSPTFLLLSSSLLLSSPPSPSPSSSLCVTYRSNILRRSTASVPQPSIGVFIRNGERRTALHSVQYRYFFDLARLPAAARRINLFIGRQILWPYMAKTMLMSNETSGQMLQ